MTPWSLLDHVMFTIKKNFYNKFFRNGENHITKKLPKPQKYGFNRLSQVNTFNVK